MSAGRRSMLLGIAFVSLWTVVEMIAAGVLSRVSPFQVVWTRYVVHLGLMLMVFGWHRPSVLWRTRRPVYQLARSLLMVGMPACWIFSMGGGVDSATLMAIFWFSPLLILAFARLVLGEVASLGIWLAALAGWSGAFLAAGRGPLPDAPLTLLLPLGMALSFSIYVVMTRALRHESTWANLFYSAAGVVLFLTPFMPGLWITPTLGDLLIMGAVGVLGFFSLLALDRMAAAAPVSQVAPLLYLQIPATLVFLFGLGQGAVTWGIACGLLLISASAWYVWSRDGRLVPEDGAGAAPALTR